MEIKDKPASMSIRDWITKKVSHVTMTPEHIIAKVISHNYDSAYDAISKNNSVEISGFGNFYYNEKRADKELQHCITQKNTWEKRYECENSTESKRSEALKQVEHYDNKIKWLINKKESKNGNS